MRVTLVALLAFHGFAHLPGFVGSWRLASFPDLPYHTTLLGGRVDVGDLGMRLVGTLWLLVALGFAAAAVGGARSDTWWAITAFVAATVSLALCVLEWPATRLGVPVNVAILVALLTGRSMGWM